MCTVTPAIVLAGGWEAAFYTFGAAAIFWFPFWAASSFEVVSDASAGGTYGTEGGAKVGVIDEWLALVKTREVKAICVAQFAQSWGGYGLLSWLPTYFEEALGVPLGDLPAFTVLPYFIQGIVGVASGIVADRWLREGRFDVKFIRRAFQTAGMVGPAACLTGAAILGGAGATENEAETIDPYEPESKCIGASNRFSNKAGGEPNWFTRKPGAAGGFLRKFCFFVMFQNSLHAT